MKDVIRTVVVVLLIAAIASCTVYTINTGAQADKEQQAKLAQLQATPDVKVLGTYDGDCVVKEVNDGKRTFYLARCGNTTTTTRNVQSGKYSRTVFEITQDINLAIQERDQLTAQEGSVLEKEKIRNEYNDKIEKLLKEKTDIEAGAAQ